MNQKKKKWSSLKRLFKRNSKTSNETTINETNVEDVFVIESTPNDDFEIEAGQRSIFVIEPTPKEFKILGLDEDVTDKEIKERYRYLIKKYHPDTGGDPKQFMKIRKAYEKIMQSRSSN